MRNLTPLFAQEFPDQAEDLDACTERYALNWFNEWLYGQRSLNQETWIRDITLMAIVFVIEHSHHVSRQRACEFVTRELIKEHHHFDDMVPIKPLEIEALTLDHAALLG